MEDETAKAQTNIWTVRFQVVHQSEAQSSTSMTRSCFYLTNTLTVLFYVVIFPWLLVLCEDVRPVHSEFGRIRPRPSCGTTWTGDETEEGRKVEKQGIEILSRQMDFALLPGCIFHMAQHFRQDRRRLGFPRFARYHHGST